MRPALGLVASCVGEPPPESLSVDLIHARRQVHRIFRIAAALADIFQQQHRIVKGTLACRQDAL